MDRFLHSVDRVIFLDGDDVRRAPMAAALFDRFAKQDPVLSSWHIRVDSAGTGKYTEKVGAYPDAKAQGVMRSMGLDISSHKASTITLEEIEEASIVLAIETKHKKYVDENVCVYPALRSKIVFFFDYLGDTGPIFDSLIGSDISAYAGFAKRLEELLPQVAWKFKQDTHSRLLARGQGFGTGVVEAKARNLGGGEPETGGMNRGDVLIYKSNHVPGRLAEMASAIITDSHSEMSHLSQTAYEFGKPCVGGTSHGTKVIDDEATVSVDSTRGLVYRR